MGYLGRRIGLSQDQADSNPGAADGAVGGGLLDLIAHGYFERQGKIYNAPGAAPIPPQGLTATGGIISDYVEPSPGKIYRAHIFTTSGTFDVSAIGDFTSAIEYLVVGGGGGSGSNGGGGGGAGGFRTNLTGHPLAGSSYTVSTTNPYTVTVGSGGAGGYVTDSMDGSNGGNSEFHPTPVSHGDPTFIRSNGGGGSGGFNRAGLAGGSGGGAGMDNDGPPYTPRGAGNSPDATNPAQGFAGGDGFRTGSGGDYNAGGGGGATAAGTSASSGTSGAGGAGSPISITGTNVTYAGGGGGGAAPGQTGGAGGAGGGGGGWPSGAGGAFDATGTGGTGLPASPADNRQQKGANGAGGSGGGGGGAGHSPSEGGNGGSGVVVIRYQIGEVAAVAKATGGAISFLNNKTIHAFTHTGDFNNTSGANLTGCEVIILGGGGGGGCWQGAGGGAGRFYRNDDVTISPGPQAVTIGGGGPGAITPSVGYPAIVSAPNGTQSVFNSVTMPGGGGGGFYSAGGGTGGSGGGGSYVAPSNPGAASPGNVVAVTNVDTPADGAGNAGGDGNSPQGAGGGGGAGGLGADGDPSNKDAGPGGLGIQLPSTFRDPASTIGFPSNSAKYFVGGGGGGGGGSPGPTANSGGGGGAPVVPYPNQGTGITPANRDTYEWSGAGSGADDTSPFAATPAQANSGSGGGGSGQGAARDGLNGGNGGSGLVLIAYPS